MREHHNGHNEHNDKQGNIGSPITDLSDVFLRVLRGSFALCVVFVVSVVVLLSGCRPQTPTNVVSSAPPTVPAVEFRDVTEKAGIAYRHVNGAEGDKWLPETMGGGGGFIDYDGDGWLDIVFINSGNWAGKGKKLPAVVLYRNRRDGTFEDVTAKVGLTDSFYGMGLAVGDFDNSGTSDLFVTAVGQSRLYRNIGGRFVNVTEQSGIRDQGWATSAAWLDYDRDGNLDLFVCHYVQWSPKNDVYASVDGRTKSYARPQSYQGESCRLYRNRGAGKFEDVTENAGILNTRSKALGVAILDYDDDNLPDIFVANDTEPNFLFHNQGDGTFKNVGAEAGIAVSDQGTSRAGMGVDAADVQNRGTFDVLITNFSGEQLTLYRRDTTGAGLYLDVAAQSGVGLTTQIYLGFGAFFFDYDLDGRQDILVNNGHIQDDIDRDAGVRGMGVTYAEPCLLFHNEGTGKFTDVSRNSGDGLTAQRVGRGAAYGDYDNNGSLDVLILTNNGAPALLQNNNKTGNNWFRLILRGTASNRCALGARVRVTVGGVTQTQEVRSGSSYLAASDTRLTFGLGKAAQADSIEIRWSSGRVQPVQPVPAGQTLTVTESK
jgi:enediyne biosynthesis protein E4